MLVHVCCDLAMHWQSLTKIAEQCCIALLVHAHHQCSSLRLVIVCISTNNYLSYDCKQLVALTGFQLAQHLHTMYRQ